MNSERIRLLKHQASIWCDENIPEQYSEEIGYGAAWEDKFAELIIRECANIATMNQHQWDQVGDYVLEHFGVE